MIKKVLKTIGIILFVIILAVFIFLGILTITEYSPDSVERVDIMGNASSSISLGDELSVLTWNIGYGGLSEDADFFMDGGNEVRAVDEEGVINNVNNILAKVEEVNADVIFLQEIDRDSSRTFHMNQVKTFEDNLPDYQSSFANNFKALVPYPVPPIGLVDSGVAIFSKLKVQDAQRIALPCPFSWPIRIANLKRCLLVERTPLEGSDKELVFVNFHLEAYDDGEGKIAQTKQLIELLDSEIAKGNYVIAGGDFNQTFSNIDLSVYPYLNEDIWHPGIIDVNDFDEKYNLLMDNSYPTCRSLDKPLKGADINNFQFYVIDGFVVSSNIDIIELNTIDAGFKNSDHNPVLLKAKLN